MLEVERSGVWWYSLELTVVRIWSLKCVSIASFVLTLFHVIVTDRLNLGRGCCINIELFLYYYCHLRHFNKKRYRYRYRYRYRQTDRQTHTQTHTQTHRQTHRHTDTHTDTQTHRQRLRASLRNTVLSMLFNVVIVMVDEINCLKPPMSQILPKA